jgi:hypothetical protein
MAFKFGLLGFLCFCVLSCGTSEKTARSGHRVAGVYLNTYSAQVINPKTGVVIGSRTVKDTLFILETNGEYEISNRKWMFNDYDSSGWVTRMPGESESMPNYLTEFNRETSWLEPIEKGKHPPLFFEENKIFLGEAKALEYVKIEEVLE